MTLGPNNAVQLYIDVQKASGKEAPHYPDFFKFAIEKGELPLIQAVLKMNEERDFDSPQKIVNKLNEKYFTLQKEPIAPQKWADRVGKKDVSKNKMNAVSAKN
jgi:hypothetical protein